MPKPLQCAILGALALFLANAAFAQTDNGASYNLLLKARISDSWFLISRSNMASRNNHDDNFLVYTGAGLGYQLSDRWSLRAGYRRAWFKFSETWEAENRPYLEGYYAGRWHGFRATSRSRLEFRRFENGDADERFRNEFTLEAPWELTPLALRLYVEEEFFYSIREEHFEANWLGLGLAWRPVDGVKLKLGYRWNHFRVGDDWRNRNVIVTGLNLFF